jgi:hypothetical protein
MASSWFRLASFWSNGLEWRNRVRIGNTLASVAVAFVFKIVQWLLGAIHIRGFGSGKAGVWVCGSGWMYLEFDRVCPCLRGALLVFSTRVPVISVVGAQLLQGDVLLLTDRITASTLKTNSKTQSPQVGAGNTVVTNCMGQLRHTGTVADVMDLRCEGAVEAELRFTMLSETRGYTYTQATVVPVSLTYGLAQDEAGAYLNFSPTNS